MVVQLSGRAERRNLGKISRRVRAREDMAQQFQSHRMPERRECRGLIGPLRLPNTRGARGLLPRYRRTIRQFERTHQHDRPLDCRGVIVQLGL